MTPHTLEEQNALLTAEADGKVIRYVDGGFKPAGLWAFTEYRYEVERPLMECWANEYKDSVCYHVSEDLARHFAQAATLRVAVHLREVR